LGHLRRRMAAKISKPRNMSQETDGTQLILWNYFTSRLFECGRSVSFHTIHPTYLSNKPLNSIKITLEKKILSHLT